ncbi:MAG: 5'/3'-nucleotidase SurE [Planctomycetes bacterium]|nr:5'/3'-nucleotidase SurE [Planctomycetota bacterium]
MRILLTNDDGINAPGLAALRKAVSDLGDVTVVAPDTERSGVAHSITLAQPLRIRRIYHGDEFFGFGINGAPADCVKLACREILPALPELLLSGMNLGANVAINVLYSGTVAAAIEGAMLSIPSVAFSLAETERPDFDEAARIAREVLALILADGVPERTVLNVNIPGIPRAALKGIRVTHQSRTAYHELYEKRVDPWGREYFWITGEMTRDFEREPDSDLRALKDGYVSVTPVHFDVTHYGAIPALRARLTREWPGAT